MSRSESPTTGASGRATQCYDVIVVGTGGVGSAALYHLARRGARVLGLDRFSGGHDRGSSHGQTRIIRQAYCENPSYVPLVQRAYQNWAELESRCDQQLYHEIGLLEVGPPDGLVVPGVLASAEQHQLEIDQLSPADLKDRCPGFEIPPGSTAVFERRAGYLRVESCVLAHLAQAELQGAEIRSGVTVRSWNARSSGAASGNGSITVETDQGNFEAGALVLTAGAWAGSLLAELGISLPVRRKHLHWLVNDDPRYQRQSGCPVFLYELPEGVFYGFPQIDAHGVKAAWHTGGEEVADPLEVDRSVDPAERQQVEHFIARCLPGVSGPATDHAVCLYTISPDENFIVDRHPQHSNVVLAAGLSGHGFKFTSVLGEVLADWVWDGTTQLPVEFLRIDRPGLRGNLEAT